jgi:hypothetical protein
LVVDTDVIDLQLLYSVVALRVKVIRSLELYLEPYFARKQEEKDKKELLRLNWLVLSATIAR